MIVNNYHMFQLLSIHWRPAFSFGLCPCVMHVSNSPASTSNYPIVMIKIQPNKKACRILISLYLVQCIIALYKVWLAWVA